MTAQLPAAFQALRLDDSVVELTLEGLTGRTNVRCGEGTYSRNLMGAQTLKTSYSLIDYIWERS